MTVLPDPREPADGLGATYDAWNRLTAIDTDDVEPLPVARYEYDGMNRRIEKLTAEVEEPMDVLSAEATALPPEAAAALHGETGEADALASAMAMGPEAQPVDPAVSVDVGAATTTTVTWTRWDYYFNENWQVAEERRSADLGRDLEAWYTFDESAGSTAGDSSGNGNTATLCGNATWTEGQFGNALLLDGSGDYAKVAQPAGLDFAPGSFTVSAWINPDVVTGGWRSILEYDRYNAGGDHTNWFGVWLSSTGKFHFRVGHAANGASTANSTATLATGEWTLVTAAYDAAEDEVSLYINGELDSTQTVTPTGYYTAPGHGKLTIGAWNLETRPGQAVCVHAASQEDRRVMPTAGYVTGLTTQSTRKCFGRRGLITPVQISAKTATIPISLRYKGLPSPSAPLAFPKWPNSRRCRTRLPVPSQRRSQTLALRPLGRAAQEAPYRARSPARSRRCTFPVLLLDP